MKVKDLISYLENFDQELEVKRYCEGIQFSVDYCNLNVVDKEYSNDEEVLLIG